MNIYRVLKEGSWWKVSKILKKIMVLGGAILGTFIVSLIVFVVVTIFSNLSSANNMQEFEIRKLIRNVWGMSLMLMSLQIAVKTFIRIICIVWICGEEKKIKFGKAAINGQTRTPISLEVDSLFTRIERYLIKSGN